MKKSKQVSLDKREAQILVAKVFQNRYLVRGHLGSGGMGSVFEIESNNEFHLRPALKIVDLSTYPDNMDPGAEIHAMKSISHGGFPKVNEIERDENYLYIVQEFISGKTLKEIFLDNGTIDEDILVVWMTEAAQALAHLHRQGMIHRDIKPSNIMITTDGHVKIIDLGLVRRVGFVDVADEQLIASRIYTPPERFERAPADERTDIYAFGATFYQLATGETPLDMSSDAKGQMNKMLEHLGRMDSKGLASIIKQCLATNPDKRPQSFDRILIHLQHLELLDQEVAYLEEKRQKRKMIMLGCLIGGILLMVLGYAVRTHALNSAFNEYIRQGTDYLSQNDLDDAEEAFHQAIALKGDNIAAHQGYNEVLTAEEQYDKVISDIEELFRSHPNTRASGGLMYLLGNAYYENRDYNKAVDHLKEAVDIDNSLQSNLVLGMAYCAKEDFQEANKVIADMKASDDNVDGAGYLSAQLKMLQGDDSGAIKEYKNVIAVTKDNKLKQRSYLALAAIYHDQSRYGEEIAILEKAQKDGTLENDIQIGEKLGEAYYRMGKDGMSAYYNKAEKAFKRLIDNGYAPSYIYRNLAIVYHEKGDLTSEAKILDDMEDRYPDDYTVDMQRAWMYLKEEDNKSKYNRNYSNFKSAYESAVDKAGDQAETDNEMQMLKLRYDEVYQMGW